MGQLEPSDLESVKEYLHIPDLKRLKNIKVTPATVFSERQNLRKIAHKLEKVSMKQSANNERIKKNEDKQINSLQNEIEMSKLNELMQDFKAMSNEANLQTQINDSEKMKQQYEKKYIEYINKAYSSLDKGEKKTYQKAANYYAKEAKKSAEQGMKEFKQLMHLETSERKDTVKDQIKQAKNSLKLEETKLQAKSVEKEGTLIENAIKAGQKTVKGALKVEETLKKDGLGKIKVGNDLQKLTKSVKKSIGKAKILVKKTVNKVKKDVKKEKTEVKKSVNKVKTDVKKAVNKVKKDLKK